MASHDSLFRREMAYKYKPCIYLHRKEQYYPASIEFYLSRCSLYKTSLHRRSKSALQNSTSATLVYHAPVMIDMLPRGIEQTSHYQLCMQHNDGMGRAGQFNRDLSNIPFYVHVLPVDNLGTIEIQYFFLFVFSALKRCCCCSCSSEVDGKYGHFQHISMRVDGLGKVIDGTVFYGTQGRIGEWYRNGDLDWRGGTHPVVYLSNGTHACYANCGHAVRCWGFANDQTAHNTPWQPNELQFIDTSTRWNDFFGDFSQTPETVVPQLMPYWAGQPRRRKCKHTRCFRWLCIGGCCC